MYRDSKAIFLTAAPFCHTLPGFLIISQEQTGVLPRVMYISNSSPISSTLLLLPFCEISLFKPLISYTFWQPYLATDLPCGIIPRSENLEVKPSFQRYGFKQSDIRQGSSAPRALQRKTGNFRWRYPFVSAIRADADPGDANPALRPHLVSLSGFR